MPRLRRVDCSMPGIKRRPKGRGFSYVDERTGARVSDPETRARVRALVLPPAWRDVWICPWPNGHLQAYGIDAKGRRQYRYHDAWRTRRDAEKFDRMLEFARRLPSLRTATAEQLAASGLTRERVLASAVRLLDRGFFRIGGEDYAEENESYGLATIQKRHVRLSRDGVISFDYVSKSGKQRQWQLRDPEVYPVLSALKRRRSGGEDLLAYRSNGAWVDVRSPDINDHLRELAGGDFTAKDYRTWSGTVLAAVALSVSGPVAGSPTGRKRAITRAVSEVAHYLGNTPAVARASYIDPRVFDRYESGWVISPDALGEVDADGEPSFHGRTEEAVLDLIEEQATDKVERTELIERVAG